MTKTLDEVESYIKSINDGTNTDLVNLFDAQHSFTVIAKTYAVHDVVFVSFMAFNVDDTLVVYMYMKGIQFNTSGWELIRIINLTGNQLPHEVNVLESLATDVMDIIFGGRSNYQIHASNVVDRSNLELCA